MRRLKSLLAIILALAIVFSLAACGSKKNDNSVQDEDGTVGYIFKQYKEDTLGTPDKTINAKSIYANLSYTPAMFYGNYRLLGGDEAVKQYCADMDYVDYETRYSKQITVIPYELKTGKRNMSSSISYVKDYNWTQAYFQTELGTLLDLTCAYEIDGHTITLKPLKEWSVDKESNKITYSFSDYEFTYEFSFCGCDLTLSKDGKSVTMRAGLDVNTDDAYFHVDNYISPESQKLEGWDHIVLHYLDDKSYIYFSTGDSTKSEYHSVAKLSNDGRFTVSIPNENGIKTYQFVCFYCYNDGIVLTDGTTTYYYNSLYSDYYKTDLRSYLSEEDDSKFDELSQSQMESIVKKKESLIDDLASAFEAAGIKVSVDKTTGELAMDASVLFSGDSSVLSDTGKAFLNKFIGAYTNIVFNDKYKGFVSKTKIEGHTAPIAGSTYESGLPLSKERANAVKQYCLSAESGVNSKYISELTSTMEAVGMSNSKPIYDKQGKVDIAASRRVSFRFIINIDK